jgi:hypothetical protein
LTLAHPAPAAYDAVVAGRSVADKLLVRPGGHVWTWPAERARLLGELPSGATAVSSMREADTALLFATSAATLEAALADHASELDSPGVLWIAYPKAGRSDLKRDTLWPMLRPYGMRPISQVAIDDIWSALRFRPLAEGEVFEP